MSDALPADEAIGNKMKKTLPKGRIRKKSLRPLPKLKHKAEEVFHRFVCLRDKYICFTCDKQGNQAGHFKHNRLDFDEMNLHCQCAYCNHFLSGNLGEYAVRLIDKYGREKFDDMVFRANQPQKYTRGELEEIIEEYKTKIQDLLGAFNYSKLPF